MLFSFIGESGPNHSVECRLFSRLPHDDPTFDVAAPEIDCPAYAAVVPIRMLELRNTGELCSGSRNLKQTSDFILLHN